MYNNGIRPWPRMGKQGRGVGDSHSRDCQVEGIIFVEDPCSRHGVVGLTAGTHGRGKLRREYG